MIQILVIAFIAVWFAEWTKLPQQVEWVLNIKLWIINCGKCLGFWSGLAYGLVNYSVQEAVVIACLTSGLAMIMNKIYMRL